MTVVADLVINKPLGWSPPGIEFRRAYLYDINPVGVGAMLLASVLSISAHLGLFGPTAQAFSALVAMATALIASPLIAWATRGRYYLARHPRPTPASQRPVRTRRAAAAADRIGLRRGWGWVAGQRVRRCPGWCTAWSASASTRHPTVPTARPTRRRSARCAARWTRAAATAASRTPAWPCNGPARCAGLTPRRCWPHLDAGLAHYLLLMLVIAPLLAGLLGLLYRQEWSGLASAGDARFADALQSLRPVMARSTLRCCWLFAIVAWWLVLTHRSRARGPGRVEPPDQPAAARDRLHHHTDLQLQQARQVARRRGPRPTRPTRPRRATSATSATSCARRSTASWATRSCCSRTPSCGQQRAHAIRVHPCAAASTCCR